MWLRKELHFWCPYHKLQKCLVHGQTLTQFPIIEVQNSNLAIFLVFTKNKIKQKDRTLLTLMIGGLLVVYPWPNLIWFKSLLHYWQGKNISS